MHSHDTEHEAFCSQALPQQSVWKQKTMSQPLTVAACAQLAHSLVSVLAKGGLGCLCGRRRLVAGAIAVLLLQLGPATWA